MSKERKNELIACLGLLFVTVCWGLGFVFVKSTVEVMPPLYLLGDSEFSSALEIDVQKVFENLLPCGFVMGHFKEDHLVELFGRITFL